MSTVINTNMQSLIARDALKLNGRAMADAMEQLSTGKRINSAADDAAGLAIGQTMSAQIRSLNIAVRNANDAVSMAQTAEGALVEVSNMLQRMRELAVQASTGTISTTQRTYLATEANALGDQIDSTIANTRWNGMQVLSQANMRAGTVVQVGESGHDSTGAGVITGVVHGDIGATSGSTDFVVTKANTFKAGDVVILGSSYSFAGSVTLSAGPYLVQAASSSAFTIVNSTAATATGGGQGTVSGGDEKVALARSMVGIKGDSLASAAKSTLLQTSTSDMSDAAKSSAAIAKIDTAIGAVSTARANLGTGMNRLTSISDNLTNIAQNTTESRSRILDADYAAATTELARTMIIQQAGTAVLAQANQRPQLVLALLR